MDDLLAGGQPGMQMTPIAHMRSDFPDKFGIPRQSGLAQSLRGRVVFCAPFRNPDALRGLEDFSHIWLVWGFSQVRQEGWSPTVRPPRLGGNARMGVFATRSPYRPNPLGLSSVRLERIEQSAELGPVLHVLGADLMDGTPIYDVKPYLPYTDSHPDALGGFASETPQPELRVEIDPQQLAMVPQALRPALLETLAYDPRPRYQRDSQRVYGLSFGGLNVRFSVEDDRLTVQRIEPEE